jgi:hypothetical protein
MTTATFELSLTQDTPAAEGAAPTPDERATTFQPVEGGQETRSGEVLLVEAYAVLWLILVGWIALLWRKQRAVHSRLDALERELDKAAARPRS